MCNGVRFRGIALPGVGAGATLLIEQLLGYLNESLYSRISSTCGPQRHNLRGNARGEQGEHQAKAGTEIEKQNARGISNKCRENAPIKRCMKPKSIKCAMHASDRRTDTAQ